MEIFKTSPQNKFPPNSTWWNPQYDFHENFVIQPAAPWGHVGFPFRFYYYFLFLEKKYDNFNEVFF